MLNNQMVSSSTCCYSGVSEPFRRSTNHCEKDIYGQGVEEKSWKIFGNNMADLEDHCNLLMIIDDWSIWVGKSNKRESLGSYTTPQCPLRSLKFEPSFWRDLSMVNFLMNVQVLPGSFQEFIGRFMGDSWGKLPPKISWLQVWPWPELEPTST